VRRPSEPRIHEPTLSRAAALALCAAAVASAAPLRAQTPPAPLRIATPGGDAFAEPFFGADNGFFTKAGYDPQISILNNAGAVVAAVAGGSIDVGLGDIVGIADAIENGIPLVVFAGGGLYLSSDPTTLLCVDKDSPLTSARELNGKTVAVVTLVGLAAASTRAWLTNNGADIGTIKVIEMPQPEMRAALRRGTIAAATISEPFLSNAKDDVRIFGKPYDAVASRFLISQWITTRAWLAKNADGAKRLTAAIYQTATWANAHRDASLAMLVKYMNVDPDRMRGIRRVQFSTELAPPLIQPVIDVALKYKLVPRPLDAATVIVNPA
jgi:NitT/TauT family transport system substrate-binding protein